MDKLASTLRCSSPCLLKCFASSLGPGWPSDTHHKTTKHVDVWTATKRKRQKWKEIIEQTVIESYRDGVYLSWGEIVIFICFCGHQLDGSAARAGPEATAALAPRRH